LVHKSLEPFLNIGITQDNFKRFGKVPFMNDLLNSLERIFENSELKSIRMFVGMLFGPIDFLGFNLDIRDETSRLFVGDRSRLCKFGYLRYFV
jgi:hypothetical protein